MDFKEINIKNRRATFDYAIGDTFTAGIVLTGTEIKSVRLGHTPRQGQPGRHILLRKQRRGMGEEYEHPGIFLRHIQQSYSPPRPQASA